MNAAYDILVDTSASFREQVCIKAEFTDNPAIGGNDFCLPLRVFVYCLSPEMTRRADAPTAIYTTVGQDFSILMSDFFDSSCRIRSCGHWDTPEAKRPYLVFDPTI